MFQLMEIHQPRYRGDKVIYDLGIYFSQENHSAASGKLMVWAGGLGFNQGTPKQQFLSYGDPRNPNHQPATNLPFN